MPQQLDLDLPIGPKGEKGDPGEPGRPYKEGEQTKKEIKKTEGFKTFTRKGALPYVLIIGGSVKCYSLI